LQCDPVGSAISAETSSSQPISRPRQKNLTPRRPMKSSATSRPLMKLMTSSAVIASGPTMPSCAPTSPMA
jgi:hypothetical protein